MYFVEEEESELRFDLDALIPTMKWSGVEWRGVGVNGNKGGSERDLCTLITHTKMRSG